MIIVMVTFGTKISVTYDMLESFNVQFHLLIAVKCIL